MSLVGSLEDLGLGDILQIVSLSRKSGLLLLRSDEGDGRIVFRDGLVRAAYVKGEPEDLRGLLAAGGFADGAAVDSALERARESGRPADELVSERTGLSAERLDSLRREHVERAVLTMFGWRVGEFSFEVRSEIEDRDAELALKAGMNAQYLLMEATRLGDETRGDAPGAADDEFILSGEVVSGEASGAEPVPEEEQDPFPEAESEPDEQARHLLVQSIVSRHEPDPPSAPRTAAAPLVVIDRELRTLEWIKQELAGLFARIHIFQHVEGGIARIRQYLTRGDLPAVLVSTRVPADTLSGGDDVEELLRRLRAQASRMPILVMHDGSDEPRSGLDAADAVVTRPSLSVLVDRRRHAELQRAADALRSALEPWTGRSAAAHQASHTPSAPQLERLRAISDRLRDPATLGDVLRLVLEFAGESFARVAMFMVRDHEAVGIAQRGLSEAGGPDDAGFRELVVPLAEPAWFRRVLESGAAQRCGPSDAGDRRLAERLGRALPGEAYVAPIESGGRVAALLYADNLPGGSPLADPTALAIALHEAGLALDRALLERALAQAEGSGDAGS